MSEERGPDRDGPTAEADEAEPAGSRPLHVARRLGLLAAGLLCVGAFQWLNAHPHLVERLYATGVGPALSQPLSRLTGFVPFAVSEWLVAGYVGWVMVRTALGVRDVRRGRPFGNAVQSGALRLGRDAGVVLVLFYGLWGLNYARPSLPERLGWPEWTPPDVEELTALASGTVEEANRAYREIHGADDAGVPTELPADLEELDGALDEGWFRTVELLELPASGRRRYGPVKRLLLTPVVARFGISGFYFPWTGEANVLIGAPALTQPHSMSHEKAHQRGVGPESEANFLGFVAASRSPDPFARYAAYAFAQGQLVQALAGLDREAAAVVASRRVAGMARDQAAAREYWAAFRGVGTSVGRAVNDRYLRANRVRGGVASYGLSVRLLVTFSRLGEEYLVPGGGG